MKTIRNLILAGALVAPAFAQLNTLVQTSLSAAITNTATSFKVASATGINAPSFSSGLAGSGLYVQDIGQSLGEYMQVTGVSGTTISVLRSGRGAAHASGAMVLVATNNNWFVSVDPVGSCTKASTYVTPVLNITNGSQWLCSSLTGTWVPSWGNPSGSKQMLSATATASNAGATAIAGPLVEISGTNAITSFTMSIGWNGQAFCVVPTGAFTVTATNNIGKAATAVADRTLCFTWDQNLGTPAFTPSY